MSGLADAFAAAIRYVEYYRFSVIPLQVNGKRPAIDWKPYQERRATAQELETWFADGARNIGIVTGAISGIVVVDIDGPRGEASLVEREIELRTPIVRTPHGRHAYFAHPGTTVPNATGFFPGVDVRGDGGYVVAPPSQIDGAIYAFEDI